MLGYESYYLASSMLTDGKISLYLFFRDNDKTILNEF